MGLGEAPRPYFENAADILHSRNLKTPFTLHCTLCKQPVDALVFGKKWCIGKLWPFQQSQCDKVQR